MPLDKDAVSNLYSFKEISEEKSKIFKNFAPFLLIIMSVELLYTSVLSPFSTNHGSIIENKLMKRQMQRFIEFCAKKTDDISSFSTG